MRIILLIVVILYGSHASGQPSSFYFKHLTKSQGLSNSVVRAIAQDQFGFIWLGTQHGIFRYDGYAVKEHLFDKDKPGTLVSRAVGHIYSDSLGTLWIGGRPGLCYYDFQQQVFHTIAEAGQWHIREMKPANATQVWIASDKGAHLLDIKAHKLAPNPLPALATLKVNGLDVDKAGNTWLATSTGLWLYRPGAKALQEILPPNVPAPAYINDVSIDQKGNVWYVVGSAPQVICRLNTRTQQTHSYPYLHPRFDNSGEGNVKQLLCDNEGRIWATSSQHGLLLFDSTLQGFRPYSHEKFALNSLSNNNLNCLFQDRTGSIWTGTEGYGADWFNPGKSFFSGIEVADAYKKEVPYNWTRAATEDSSGNIWLGHGEGLTRYDPRNGTLQQYNNHKNGQPILHSNSIRSLATDAKGFVWIGTANGINRYNPATRRIEMLDVKEGAAGHFAWTLYLDRQQTLWLGSNRGLFRWNDKTHHFDNFRNDTLLGKYVNRQIMRIFQDSKGRYWIAGAGLFVYDPANSTVKQFKADSGQVRLLSDLLTDITEDRQGNIWIGSNAGLSCYKEATGTFTHYTRTQGLPSNETAGLLTDRHNRLWVATGNGLCCLDTGRTHFVVFDEHNGLPSNQFNEQAACRLADGRFIYPTYRGFVWFNPDVIDQQKEQVEPYITSFHLLNNHALVCGSPEVVDNVQLQYDENFFALELTTPYYTNPRQCWYAYKLEGFDVNWQYTQDRQVTYTNVPSGDYTFLYKSTIDPGSWGDNVKRLSIHIETRFIESTPFRILVVLAILLLLYGLYRLRLYQKEKIHRLHRRAESLEKEKAMAMYENLKQHLNPHFLFNSLTSLSGLIQIDPPRAADFLSQMSQIYRYILKNKDSELVHLSDEISFASLYIKLLKTRFSKGLEINIQVPEEYNYRKIVPVTLQNLIENAIKHNVIDEESPLVIDITVDDDYLVVSNNLQRKKMVDTSNKQGLENMRSFYSYLSNLPLITEERNNIFTVKIPLI